MHPEFDYDLALDQWETLKALRTPGALPRKAIRHQLEKLIALELVVMCEDLPLLTTRGRKVLIRGSSRLLDVAA
jgi:hypothetical protein